MARQRAWLCITGTPAGDELTLHQSLGPNPDGNETLDDDVDSLDVIPLVNTPFGP